MSENRRFSDVFRGYRNATLGKYRLNKADITLNESQARVSNFHENDFSWKSAKCDSLH